MKLTKRMMDLKGPMSFVEMSRLSGVSASIISDICNGKRTIDFDDEFTDIKVGELKYIANFCFDMTMARLMKPVTEFTDNNIISISRTKINGDWVSVSVERV